MRRFESHDDVEMHFAHQASLASTVVAPADLWERMERARRAAAKQHAKPRPLVSQPNLAALEFPDVNVRPKTYPIRVQESCCTVPDVPVPLRKRHKLKDYVR